jgi:hypothetical protein
MKVQLNVRMLQNYARKLQKILVRRAVMEEVLVLMVIATVSMVIWAMIAN